MEKEQYIKIVLPMRNKLLSYAETYVDEEEAKDIVQYAMLKLYCIRKSVDEHKNIKAFIYEITKNLCINLLRKEKMKRIEPEEIMNICDEKNPYNDLKNKEDLKNTKKIIKMLPSLQQTILRMRNIEGLEVSEIAELTGGNEISVRANLSRARKKIKELFLNIEK